MASESRYEEHGRYWIPARICVVTAAVSRISAIGYNKCKYVISGM
jgi:hypothetical protein